MTQTDTTHVLYLTDAQSPANRSFESKARLGAQERVCERRAEMGRDIGVFRGGLEYSLVFISPLEDSPVW